LILILVVHTSYCQYPITKKIKNDSVIIITTKQGQEINNLYNSYNDTIRTLKNYLTDKNIKYDSLFNSINDIKDTFYNYKWRYEINKQTYYKREADFKSTQKLEQIGKYILVGIIFLQFETISYLQHKIK